MSVENAIVTVQYPSVFSVPFHNDVVYALEDGGHRWVVFRRMCECMEMTYRTQHRLLTNAVWAKNGFVLRPVRDADGTVRDMLLVRIDVFEIWLRRRKPRRHNTRTADIVRRFQNECVSTINACLDATKSKVTDTVALPVKGDGVRHLSVEDTTAVINRSVDDRLDAFIARMENGMERMITCATSAALSALKDPVDSADRMAKIAAVAADNAASGVVYLDETVTAVRKDCEAKIAEVRKEALDDAERRHLRYTEQLTKLHHLIEHRTGGTQRPIDEEPKKGSVRQGVSDVPYMSVYIYLKSHGVPSTEEINGKYCQQLHAYADRHRMTALGYRPRQFKLTDQRTRWEFPVAVLDDFFGERGVVKIAKS